MEITIAIILSAFISADRFAAMHLGLSRPIVISLIIGMLFGHVQETFLVGIIFELVGLIDVPVGTRIPKDDTFGAYAASLMISLHDIQNISGYSFIILTILIVMVPVTYSCQLGRKFNKRNYLKQLKKDKIVPEKLIVMGFLFSMLRGVVIYNLGYLLVHLAYTVLEDGLSVFNGQDAYLTMIIVFLAGYLIRFLSAKSSLKYALFVGGLLTGWFVL